MDTGKQTEGLPSCSCPWDLALLCLSPWLTRYPTPATTAVLTGCHQQCRGPDPPCKSRSVRDSVFDKLCLRHGLLSRSCCPSHPCANATCSVGPARALRLPRARLALLQPPRGITPPRLSSARLFPTALPPWTLTCKSLSPCLHCPRRTPRGTRGLTQRHTPRLPSVLGIKYVLFRVRLGS